MAQIIDRPQPILFVDWLKDLHLPKQVEAAILQDLGEMGATEVDDLKGLEREDIDRLVALAPLQLKQKRLKKLLGEALKDKEQGEKLFPLLQNRQPDVNLAEVRELLFNHHADPSVIDESVHTLYTPLHWAARNGHADCIAPLVEAGADPNAEDKNIHTRHKPLHVAALNGHASCIGPLVKKGADPNTKDKNGDTPLHLAADRGHANCINCIGPLLEAGADLKNRNNEERTARDCAVSGKKCGWEEVVRLLDAHEKKSTSGFGVGLWAKAGPTRKKT
eukprot:CAMPEP_0171687076 /NCGR_PEP_ID=MMETSP0991-20121206/3157_1 /TAXON_ID=483369 /ORGANISM="non described non described, Strain CCMP2098" /LENGTH=276 /DNA_ID=CAMNT_0012274903 /DNA_START=80 /DNA_END=910 /DNA_ORIENTATION=-